MADAKKTQHLPSICQVKLGPNDMKLRLVKRLALLSLTLRVNFLHNSGNNSAWDTNMMSQS